MDRGAEMTLEEINKLGESAFMERFGDVAEHSPWVAERAALSRPFADREAMIDAFQRAVATATRTEQANLIKAHPDLASRAKLAQASASEQAGAGLDGLSEDELARFTELNGRYRTRFGFPFIYAVKGARKAAILSAFESRLDGGRVEEFWTALSQVMRIVRFRLEERVDG
jgi:2-oxo-4-hydroxy-4-carboxy-5-ureidoimidazoline decarboxylase